MAQNALAERLAAATTQEQKESEELDAAWTTKSLELAPGSLILEIVFKKYGVSFRKESDGPRLAELMNREAIHADIVRLLKTISA
jgi:hypothetical protein